MRVGAGNSRRLSVARRSSLEPSSAAASSAREVLDADLDRLAGEHLGAERLRPSAGQLAELARHEADDRVGDVVVLRVLGEVGRVGVHGREVQREVADDLRRRRHLGDAAEDRFAAAYMSSTSSKSSARPSAFACWRRLDSWPPGISCL